MRLFLILIIGVLASLSTLGQVIPRNLLTNHFRQEDVKAALIPKNQWKPFPQTSAEWKARIPQRVIDEIVKRGESFLGKDVPQVPATLFLEYVRTGNRSRYEEKSFARRNQLMDMLLAESIEDKGRFTDTIANYVWAILEETYWGIPAHVGEQKAKSGLPDEADPTVDLFGAETVATLALADYLVGEKLDKVSPLIRKRIYADAYSKIFNPIKQSQRYNWLDPAKKVNNWNPWIMSNLIAANLLLELDEAKRSENLYQYMKWLDIYLNGLGEDGGCDEGPSYWFAAGGSVFDSLEILSSATGGKVNIFKEPLIGKMASYIYKMHIADNYFVNFADADPRFDADGVLIYRFGKALGDETLSAFGVYLFRRDRSLVGEGFMKPRRILDYLSIKEIADLLDTYKPPTDSWFPDIQVMTSRSVNGIFVASHAGNNAESHNHNDVGDVVLYSGNEPVLIDAGRGNYTAKTFSSKRYELWFTQSEYHNLPIFNGVGQSDGAVFKAADVKYELTNTGSRLSMEIAPAYAKTAGIEKFSRTVNFNRSNGNLAIHDDFTFKKSPNSIGQVFMTVCDVDLSQNGVILLKTISGKQFEIKYDSGWKAAVEFPSMEGPEYSSFERKWAPGKIKRIVLTASQPENIKGATYSVASR